MFHIVLVEPTIPQNTGNIARSCAITGTMLHLVGPLGFSVDDKYLRRAGLDYWDKMQVCIYENFSAFLQENRPDEKKVCLYTTKATRRYSDVTYEDGSYLVFGSETSGLKAEIHEMFYDNRLTIPMRSNPELRSLNLSNAAAIVLYEALRQHNFAELDEK